METDKVVETFSKALFTYLWHSENLISSGSIIQTADLSFEFVADAAKAVVVLSAFSDPSFNEIMDDYFERHTITRLGAFTLISSLSFKNHAESSDIFFVALNTLSFVYRIVVYCYNRGHEEFVLFGSMCWTEIFQSDLKEEFYAEGGWNKFKEYISDNRYVPLDNDAEKKALAEYLEEIDYLFPKLKSTDESQDEDFPC